MDNDATSVQSFSGASYVFQMICHFSSRRGTSQASHKSVSLMWTRLQCCRTVVLSSHRQPGEYSEKKSKQWCT